MLNPVLSRGERLIRSWVVAVLATTLAAASHGLAGGLHPPLILWGLCTALSALICLAFSGRRLHRLGLAVSVFASQGIFHTLFAHVHTGPIAHVPTAHAVHGHNFPLSSEREIVSHTLEDHAVPMLVLHLLAGLMTYWMIRHGEATVARAREFLQLVLERILDIHRRYRGPVAVDIKPVPVCFLSFSPALFLRGVRLVRGPPAGCV